MVNVLRIIQSKQISLFNFALSTAQLKLCFFFSRFTKKKTLIKRQVPVKSKPQLSECPAKVNKSFRSLSESRYKTRLKMMAKQTIFAAMKAIRIIWQYLIMLSVLSLFERSSSFAPDNNQTFSLQLVILILNLSFPLTLCPYSIQFACIIWSNFMLFWMRKDNSIRIRHYTRPKSILITGIIKNVMLQCNRPSNMIIVSLMRKSVSNTVKIQNTVRGAVLYFFQRIKKFHML